MEFLKKLLDFSKHPYFIHMTKCPSWKSRKDAFLLMLLQGMDNVLPGRFTNVCDLLSEQLFQYDSQTWELPVRSVLNPSKNEVVLDIGASDGRYLQYLADRAASVICFEPHPKAFKRLKDRANNYHNTQVYDYAIGDEIGSVDFYLNSNSDLSGFIHRSRECIRVKSVTIDYFISKEPLLDKIDWIKIDVEGSEISVLKGATETLKTHRPRMVIEIHGEYSYKNSIDFLSKNQYQVRSIWNWTIWNDERRTLDSNFWIYAEPLIT